MNNGNSKLAKKDFRRLESIGAGSWEGNYEVFPNLLPKF